MIAVLSIACFIPFLIVIAGSFTSETELLLNGYGLFVKAYSFEAYRLLAQSAVIYRSFGISIAVTGLGTALALSVTSALAYSIASKKNLMRNGLAFYVYFTMLFNGGVVPFYILVSGWLQLRDTIWALILPSSVNPFFVIIAVAYFRRLPDELAECGRIDGASEWIIFLRLILPISIPIMAVIALFYGLAFWNDWFMPLLFIQNEALFPLQLLLHRIIGNPSNAGSILAPGMLSGASYPGMQLQMAMLVLTVCPIILVYPLVQRYFIHGITISAIKR